jgi:hypothetical protein
MEWDWEHLSTSDVRCGSLNFGEVFNMVLDHCGVRVIPEEIIEAHVEKKKK